jgi:hypothetical protein
VRLKNGADVLVRPARAADAGALQALFHRLSPDDVYTRFFSGEARCPWRPGDGRHDFSTRGIRQGKAH